MTENCANIIDLLVERRQNQGMTQKDLAEAACLKQSVVSRFENKGNVPQLDTLLKISAALDCELNIVPISKPK